MKLAQIMNNFHAMIHNRYTIYFSYETPIGVFARGELFVSENNWGRTTGKHINYIKQLGATQVSHPAVLDIIEIEID